MAELKLLNFLNEIENNPQIDIKLIGKEIFEIDPFLSEMQINTVKEKLEAKIEADSEIIKDYNLSNLKLSWLGKTDVFIYGGFRFSDWMISLSTKSDFWKIDFSLGPGDEIPADLKHFERLNWFEKQEWRDDWRYGCFVREKGKFPPDIAFFDRNWYTILDLSFDQYIDAMIASCAVMGWQYFYLDYNQDLLHISAAIPEMEKVVETLPELFPGKDFLFHKERLKELKSLKNIG